MRKYVRKMLINGELLRICKNEINTNRINMRITLNFYSNYSNLLLCFISNYILLYNKLYELT